jgi:choline dehydrogenase-like flavoprotein
LAAILASGQPEARILLLEAGPDTASRDLKADSRSFEHKDADLDYGYTTTPQRHLKGRVLPYARGKGLGGCSTINRLIWTTGGEHDYNHWADMVGDHSWKWETTKDVFKKVSWQVLLSHEFLNLKVNFLADHKKK